MHQRSHIERLSWAVDAAVGIEIGGYLFGMIVVEVETAVGRCLPIALVCLRISIDDGVAPALTRLQLGARHRLTRLTIDNLVTVLAAWLRLTQHKQVADVQQIPDRQLASRKLQQIDTQRQRLNQHGILELLERSMASIAVRLRALRHQRQVLLQILPVVLVGQIHVVLARQVRLVDTHGELLHVAHVLNRHLGCRRGVNQLAGQPHLKLGVGHRLFRIA